MRIALAQMDCVVGDAAANAAKIAQFAAEAQAARCEVLFLPELATTGYAADAATAGAGAEAEAVRNAAGEHGIAVVCGWAEQAGETLHNSLTVVDAAGEPVAGYRKLFLFDGAGAWEPGTFKPGTEHVVAEFAGRRWGLSICYDLRFPELYRVLADRGATALVNCSAWPNVRWQHWDLLTRARAVENQAFFIGVNRCGTDPQNSGGPLTMAGRSRVVAPTGELLVEAGPDEEELLIADLDFAAVDAFRQLLPALPARRPELYAGH
ncbi:nitrilase-related carbon-nitrogen hydrolase [Alienimonas californiensis]|uniref:2-oxoglutaramate amidase n=1 Tax=Alienimonas californiensis TaxID=2527989 RepID=A0A517PEZ7_9PLAN|nr:nitrilase-related carbon-nitrogen hydrolase [Alienimonas californiensis]QDT17943.1 2-oxoglutaramate amidase [Alienimonas californiensis]